MKTAVIGGVIGGVLSSIPLLSLLNCCFCLLNMAGAAIGISMYLSAHPGEKISSGDAAISGTVSGAVTGVVYAVSTVIMNMAIGSMLANVYASMPPQVRANFIRMTAGGFFSFGAVPIYAGFGALGGFLAMQLFFKDRLKS